MEHKSRVYQRLKYQRGQTLSLEGITCLEVPMSWPTKDDYDETVDYDLEDPKTIGREEVAKWKTVTCPMEIEYYLRLWN